MRHAIVGAGGVGGTIGVALAHCDETVTFVVRPETLAGRPETAQLKSTFGSWAVPAAWAASIPACDVVWLTVKATQLESSLELIPADGSFRAIVPLLNGLDHLQVLRAKFGAERVIPATIAGEMERVGAAEFVHPSPFLMLNVSGRGRELLGRVLDELRGLGLTCNFIDDETTLMWSKLVFLGPFALTTTAFNKTVGEVMGEAATWQQMEACVRETCAAGVAEGAKLDVETILKTMKMAPAGMRSSMQKDVVAGRPPELDAIGGAIVRAAKRHGLKAAVTEDLMAQIERRFAARKAS